jgi:hypothetical protein
VAEGVPTDSRGLQPAAAGDFRDFRSESQDDRVFWIHWYLAKGNVAVRVTYNCASLADCEAGLQGVAFQRVDALRQLVFVLQRDALWRWGPACRSVFSIVVLYEL